MSHWQIHNHSANKKARKWEERKVQNKIHRQCKIFGQLYESLTDNLAEDLHEGKCKDCISVLNMWWTMMVTNIQVCEVQQNFRENTCSFCDGDFNKFCIEFQKGV